jgi:DNA-binding NtrC family response regulator
MSVVLSGMASHLRVYRSMGRHNKGNSRKGSWCTELCVVLIDDEAAFRTALAENLRDDGHPVVEYSRPDQIVSLASLQGAGVAILEYRLPGQDGVSFADRFHGAHPQVPVVLLTTSLSGPLEDCVQARGFLSVLVKPVDYRLLHQTIHGRAPHSHH